MECKNNFCIYYSNYECLKSEKITLDADGRCEQCLYVNVSEDILEKERIKSRKKQELYNTSFY